MLSVPILLKGWFKNMFCKYAKVSDLKHAFISTLWVAKKSQKKVSVKRKSYRQYVVFGSCYKNRLPCIVS